MKVGALAALLLFLCGCSARSEKPWNARGCSVFPAGTGGPIGEADTRRIFNIDVAKVGTDFAAIVDVTPNKETVILAVIPSSAPRQRINYGRAGVAVLDRPSVIAAGPRSPELRVQYKADGDCYSDRPAQ